MLFRMRQRVPLHIFPQRHECLIALPINILCDGEIDFAAFQQTASRVGQVMADNVHLSTQPHIAHGLHTPCYAVIRHVNAANVGNTFNSFPHLLIAECVL